jgi:hypothetical protein
MQIQSIFIRSKSPSQIIIIIVRLRTTSHGVIIIQFCITCIYMPSQQLQGQLQTQHSVDTDNYIMDRHNIKSKTNYSNHWRKNTLMQRSKQTNKKQMKMKRGNKNMITKNYMTQDIRIMNKYY